MSPPADTVVRRIDDTSEVKCLLSGRTWSVRCVAGQWDSDVGLCQAPAFDVHSVGQSFSRRFNAFYNESYNYIASLHPGIVLTTLVSVVVITVVIVFTCCFVCCRRREYKSQYRQQTSELTAVSKPAATDVSSKLRRATAIYSDDANDYAQAGTAPCALHRPLPSLPRRIDGSWAKSVRSDASGSDASLHWDTDDVSVQPAPPVGVQSRAVRCRSVATGDDACRGHCATVGRGTTPRPGAQYGAFIADDQYLLQQQQQQQYSGSAHCRQYANISNYSVNV